MRGYRLHIPQYFVNGRIEHIVKASKKGLCAVENIMGKDTEDLGGRTVLLNMMVVIQPA